MIKLLACLFMLMDHTAYVFFEPNTFMYLLFRIIGRLAMPIFAYNIAMGYSYTSSLRNYLCRIGVLTLVSQIPLTLMFYGQSFVDYLISSKGLILLGTWNIGLTFACSLLIIFYINKIGATSTMLQKLLYFNLILILFIVGSFGDYGIYGISIVLIFYYLKKYSYRIQALAITSSTILYYVLNNSGAGFKPLLKSISLQLFCIFSLVIIKCLKNKKINLPKSFFYWFYPMHMLILSILRFLY